MQTIRYILYPFSLLYGLGVYIRNKCYAIGLLKSNEFDIPVISIGNLEVGGSGKTPFTEYIVRLLYKKNSVATLSRLNLKVKRLLLYIINMPIIINLAKKISTNL